MFAVDGDVSDVAPAVVAGMNNRQRTGIAALALSAAALVGLVAGEGYSDRAIIPVKGDRPTVGFGSTFKPDGAPVRMGDTITPQRALEWTMAHLGKDEAKMRACVRVPLYQAEYDAYVQLAYNIGADAFCSSTLVRMLNAGDYVGACKQILRWDRFQGKPLRGLTLRRQREFEHCIQAAR